MNVRRILEIARWEYLQKVRSRAFVVSLLLTPAMIGLGVTLPAMLAESEPDETQMIGLVDHTDSLYGSVRTWLQQHERLSTGAPAYVLASFPSDAAADSAVLADRIEGAMIVRDSAGTLMTSYRSENPGNFRAVAAFQRALQRALRDQRLMRAGIDTAGFAELVPDVDVKTVKISESGDEGSVGFGELFFTAYFLSILLMILVLTTGGTLVRSLIEEKSNRIMEILVSSATPLELLWGKLLGLSGLGVTQVVVWLAIGVGFAGSAAGSADVAQQLMRIYAVLPLLVLYLALGYAFYSAIFVGLGSLASTEQEAQVTQTWLVMLLMIPVMISIGVISDPDAAWVRGLSYLPVFTPSLMMLRVVTQMPDPLEIAGTIASMILSTAAVTWVCARIFRTAILMTGKRPGMREVWRWVKG